MQRLITYLRYLAHNLPTDRWVAYTFVLALTAYCVSYGIYVTNGWIVELPTVAALVQITILIFVVDGIKTSYEGLLPKRFVKGTSKSGDVTVLVPSYNGAKVIGRTITNLLNRFEPEQIIIMPNGCSDNTAAVASSFGVRVLDFPKPIGKCGALNEGLKNVKTRYTIILDDDTILGDDLLPIPAMEKGGYSAAAFRVFPIVTTWVTKIQNYEYRKSMDIGKAAQNLSGTVQNVSGAVGLFKTAELYRQLHLHSGEFSGEDLQRTLLIHADAASKGVIISDAIVVTEAPETIGQLYRQRVLGWTPGAYANLGLFWKVLWAKHTPHSLRLDAFYNSILVCGFDLLRLFTFPILVFYPWLLLLTYIVYIALELIPYLLLGKDRGPFWVVLLYPIYGLFNFVTRLSGFAVFIYRRTAVYLEHATHPDDYKQAPLGIRARTLLLNAVSVGCICLIMLGIRTNGLTHALQAYGHGINTVQTLYESWATSSPDLAPISEDTQTLPTIIDLDAPGAGTKTAQANLVR